MAVRLSITIVCIVMSASLEILQCLSLSGQFPDGSVYADELLMFMKLSESNLHSFVPCQLRERGLEAGRKVCKGDLCTAAPTPNLWGCNSLPPPPPHTHTRMHMRTSLM